MTETHSGGTLGALSMNWTYDNALRRDVLTAKYGINVLQAADCEYDTAGGLSQGVDAIWLKVTAGTEEWPEFFAQYNDRLTLRVSGPEGTALPVAGAVRLAPHMPAEGFVVAQPDPWVIYHAQTQDTASWIEVEVTAQNVGYSGGNSWITVHLATLAVEIAALEDDRRCFSSTLLPTPGVLTHLAEAVVHPHASLTITSYLTGKLRFEAEVHPALRRRPLGPGQHPEDPGVLSGAGVQPSGRSPARHPPGELLLLLPTNHGGNHADRRRPLLQWHPGKPGDIPHGVLRYVAVLCCGQELRAVPVGSDRVAITTATGDSGTRSEWRSATTRQAAGTCLH